jgi:hypothetical protein
VDSSLYIIKPVNKPGPYKNEADPNPFRSDSKKNQAETQTSSGSSGKPYDCEEIEKNTIVGVTALSDSESDSDSHSIFFHLPLPRKILFQS